LQLTIPNVFLNDGEAAQNRSRFFAGDWQSFDDLVGDIKYDVILTSDTLYAVDSYNKLYFLIKNHIKEGGVAYVAAKKYYFGVGGSTHQFVQVVKNHNPTVQIRTVKNIQDGQSNVREIIRLIF